ncbi:MAG: hypothetical protein WA125_16690 [Desulfosporosinus sp.]
MNTIFSCDTCGKKLCTNSGCNDYSLWTPRQTTECRESKQRWNMEKYTGVKEHILHEAIQHYGEQAQFTKAIEECGELIIAIAKSDLPNIAEEVADVRIMLDQVEIMLGLDTGMIRQSKLERLSERISQEQSAKTDVKRVIKQLMQGNKEDLRKLEEKCQRCLFHAMTREEIDKIGEDPCETCGVDCCNRKPKEDES